MMRIFYLLFVLLLIFTSCKKHENTCDELNNGQGPTNPTGTVNSPKIGVQFHEWNIGLANRDQVLNTLVANGVGWIRVDIGWRTFEENCDDCYSQYYVDRIDNLIDAARALGLEVLLTVHQTPEWANVSGNKYEPPTDATKFGEFMGWLAAQYEGKVIGYEIWNEPNLEDFFIGTPAQYADLLKAAYPAIKLADPNAKVVFGGPSYQDASFITQVYQEGTKDFFDVMSTHPYQGQSDAAPETESDGNIWWLTEQTTIESVMQQFGDSEKEIWWTEFGWSTHSNASNPPPYRRGVTEEEQGNFIVRTLKFATQNYSRVTRVSWYNAVERDAAGEHLKGYGLIRSDMNPKPALDSLRIYLESL